MYEFLFFFFFNDTATTEIYTLSLHDALPIFDPASADQHEGRRRRRGGPQPARQAVRVGGGGAGLVRLLGTDALRSEEHTSELQSRQYLVCRLLLEKKKKNERQTTSRDM